MIHTNGTIDAKKLARVKVVTPPGAGRNWKAVPFKDVAAAMTADLHDRKLKPVNEWFALSPKKDVMVGVWDCQGGPKLPKGVTLQVGVMSGNDRHTPLTVYGGLSVKDEFGSYSVVLDGLKSGGRTSIHSCVAGRLKALTDQLAEETSDEDEYAGLANIYQQDTSRSEYDLLEALVRGAEWKLYPWTHVRQGVKLWRDKVRTYSVTPAGITACLWACLAGTNPVSHLKAGLAFNTIIFGQEVP